MVCGARRRAARAAMDEMVNRLVCVNNASGLTYIAEAPPCGALRAWRHDARRARLQLWGRRRRRMRVWVGVQGN